MIEELKVLPEGTGKRADVFVAENYPEFSRSSLEKLFDKGMITLSGQPVKAGYRLKGHETLRIDESKLRMEPEPLDLPVIYENDDVIVINKPEGVLTHSKGALNDEATVATFIKSKLRDSSLIGNRAGIVHRLDRGTSGVLIAAKNTAALSKLQKQFSQRRTKKTYLAIVEGVPEQKEALINVPIERNPKHPQTFRVGSAGKPALTEYEVTKELVHNGKDYSEVTLRPTTGRTHQIRVHMAYIGHPIVGDRVYGRPANHLFLHAKSLELTLPGGERKVFTAPVPEYFNEYVT